MNRPTGRDLDIEQACRLLEEYSFELGGYRSQELVYLWQIQLEADSSWIRSAVIEALYQGRYKALSVEQILRVWKRRGYPLRHFNHEFERIVFGPVEPTASKYAPMTTLSPSELLTPQTERSNGSLAQEDSCTPEETQHPPIVEVPEVSTPPATPVSIGDSGGSTAPADVDMPPLLASPSAKLVAASFESLSSPAAGFSHLASEQSDCVNEVISTATFNQPAPIRKFVPQPAPAELYHRLQSVARHQ